MAHDKVVCVKWIGRFGNRCHSYLYGKHIERVHGSKFYIPTEWEGSVLFKNPAPVFENLKEINFVYAGGTISDKIKFQRNKQLLEQVNKKTRNKLEFIDPCLKNNYGKTNIAFTSLVTDASWFFPNVTRSEIREYFEFSDEVTKTDMYKEMCDKQKTYDTAHFRRTDISRKNYKGGHSMVSKKSYYDAFKKFDVDVNDVVWVSDEPSIGWKYDKKIPEIGGKKISWLPDFLKLMFSRKMFRSNSSFGLWAGWLGNSEVFAPWLHTYSPGEEVDFEFVKGNHPHWMAVKGVHSNYRFDIIDDIDNNQTQMEVKEQSQHEVTPTTKHKPVLMMVHWNGRFGNRLGSYAFGRTYAEKYNLDFYIPSKWEGTHLFKDTGAKVIEDDKLRLHVNQTQKNMDNLAYRAKMVAEYCSRVNCPPIKYLNPDDPTQYGNTNVFFDSLAVNGPHIFKDMSRAKILKWYEFRDEIKQLDIYKRLEDKQGTYDIAHLRRDDISNANYNKNNHQGYSVISKQSYLEAFKKFDFDVDQMEWTTDDWTGKWGVGKPTVRGGWKYPDGSKVIPDIVFDWLPDFLRLYFARNIFRANSSFSWWAAFLSPTAKTYSPVLTERKIYFKESDEVKFNFVEGNHPHWLNFKNNPKKLAEEIIIPE